MLCSRHRSGAGIPACACLRIAMIWLSVKREAFIEFLFKSNNLEILLLTHIKRWGDYPIIWALMPAGHSVHSVNVPNNLLKPFKVSGGKPILSIACLWAIRGSVICLPLAVGLVNTYLCQEKAGLRESRRVNFLQ